jgi:hypothetical protein
MNPRQTDNVKPSRQTHPVRIGRPVPTLARGKPDGSRPHLDSIRDGDAASGQPGAVFGYLLNFPKKQAVINPSGHRV